MSETARLQQNKLTELTGISGPPTSELAALSELHTPRSCEWLISKPNYSSWRIPWSDNPTIFWLLGNAGSGKSVLCSEVIHDLQKDNLRCNYFFFKHGEDVNSSIAGCLRALAYQMAKSDEAILRRMLQMEQDAVPCVQWDEGTVWRKMFLGCIFKLSKPLPQFWVLDALDECQKLATFLKMIAETPPYLRIFMTSRNSPEAQQSLISLHSLVEPYQVQNEDIMADLSLFIDSKISRLPVSDENGQFKLKEKLLNKSSGSFLWVSLIIQELEQTFSEEDAEEILDEVPEDMNRVYARMLKNLPSNDRAMRLAHCLVSWTLLTRRALTLSEVQSAIKFDINQTVHNLAKSLPAICGQFMSVDRSDCVRSIHQTARAFLLNQDVVPELIVDEQVSHTRIAQACLKCLNGNQLQGAHLQRPKSVLAFSNLGSGLFNYACTSFSDHVRKSMLQDSATFKLLCSFLDTRIPLWIEHLAREAKLHHVTRTAKNLQSYLKRCRKSVSLVSPGTDRLDSWIKDLMKISGKFRAHLAVSPSAIHQLIPSLCPNESMMSKVYPPREQGFTIKGLNEKTWGDCLARIDFPDQQTCALAIGDQHVAVAVSGGSISLHYRDSFQLKHTLVFGERVRALALSNNDIFLAAGGLRKLKVWDTNNGAQFWAFDLAHAALSMMFDDELEVLAVATQGAYIVHWDLQDGSERERWEWNQSITSSGSLQKPNRSPGKVLLSPTTNTLAVSYRGLPVYLFDTRSKKCIGCCQRKAGSISTARANQYLVDAFAFNSNAEIDVVIVSYADGELAVFSTTSTKLSHCIANIFAQTLACSPNGGLLATGSSQGSIHIFEFSGVAGDRLSLVYRISAHEDAVRSIAFSSDSLHFADIRGSYCHIWEPAILLQDDLEEGSQSEFSQGSTFVPESKDMEDCSHEAEITVLCPNGSGSHAFCGKIDGTVVLFETSKATQQDVLYQHARDVRITSIAYNDPRDLLMTADESGRVLVYEIFLAKDLGEIACPVGDISTEEPIQKVLPDPMGNGLLLIGRDSATLRTLQGDLKGAPVSLFDGDERCIVSLHPRKTDNFVVLSRKSLSVYSWANGAVEQPQVHSTLGSVSLTITPPTPLMPSFSENEDSVAATKANAPAPTVNCIIHLFPTSSGKHILNTWPAETIPKIASSSPLQPLPDPFNLGSKVLQIIAMWGNRLLFLDTNHWICSLEITPQEICVNTAKRHFFLLSEWQSGVGSERFNIQFSAPKREIIIAFKDRILVAKMGLDIAEPWNLT